MRGSSPSAYRDRGPGDAGAGAGGSSTVEDVVDQRPAVLVVENTHNVAGGRVWPLDELDAVVAVAEPRASASTWTAPG